MTRIAGLLFFLTAATAALFLFHIKQQVRELEEELGIVHSDILKHQEAIQILNTEWSYLNRPARIAELAERHLDMQQLTAPQFVGFEDIPFRSAGAALPGDGRGLSLVRNGLDMVWRSLLLGGRRP